MVAARDAGVSLFTGVPCSFLQPFINYVIDAPEMMYVAAANEGDAVAIASGAALAGVLGVVMFQNSGLGNAVNPLSSLNAVSRLPVLIITTWRGEPGGVADEPQHELMGQITQAMLELLRIPHEPFPETEQEIQGALERAVRHMTEHRTPYGLIMRKGAVAPHALLSRPSVRNATVELAPEEWPQQRPSRQDALATIRRANPNAALLATTGYTGRVLYKLGDTLNQFYLVGAMGCVSSVALGLAKAQPARRVIAIDGDGAALMRLGALATIGHESPLNLVHVLLDNEVHDSTGGQATVSHSVDIGRIAAACGYATVRRCATLDALADALRSPAPGPTFLHVKTAPGESPDLPRPTVSPAEVATRFSHWLKVTPAQ